MNTTYFRNLIANHIYHGAGDGTLPDTYYLGLSSTAPSADGTGVTEPSASGGYARVAITGVSAAADGVVTNSNALSFSESITGWGTVNYFVVYDAATGGNLLMSDAMTTPRTIEEGTIMTVKAGALELRVVDIT